MNRLFILVNYNIYVGFEVDTILKKNDTNGKFFIQVY